MNAALIELAERCEKATGPDEALDAAIWLATKADDVSRKAYEEGLKLSRQEASFRLSYMSDGFMPTASLDSAITLVPDGWGYSICPGSVLLTRFLSDAGVMGRAAATALALCAASLRARAQEVPTNG